MRRIREDRRNLNLSPHSLTLNTGLSCEFFHYFNFIGGGMGSISFRSCEPNCVLPYWKAMSTRIFPFSSAPISEIPGPCFSADTVFSCEIQTAFFSFSESTNNTRIRKSFVIGDFCLEIDFSENCSILHDSLSFFSLYGDSLSECIRGSVWIYHREANCGISSKFHISGITFPIRSCRLKYSSSEIPFTESSCWHNGIKIYLTDISLAHI